MRNWKTKARARSSVRAVWRRRPELAAVWAACCIILFRDRSFRCGEKRAMGSTRRKRNGARTRTRERLRGESLDVEIPIDELRRDECNRNHRNIFPIHFKPPAKIGISEPSDGRPNGRYLLDNERRDRHAKQDPDDRFQKYTLHTPSKRLTIHAQPVSPLAARQAARAAYRRHA